MVNEIRAQDNYRYYHVYYIYYSRINYKNHKTEESEDVLQFLKESLEQFDSLYFTPKNSQILENDLPYYYSLRVERRLDL